MDDKELINKLNQHSGSGGHELSSHDFYQWLLKWRDRASIKAEIAVRNNLKVEFTHCGVMDDTGTDNFFGYNQQQIADLTAQLERLDKENENGHTN